MLHGARPLNQPTLRGKVLRMSVDDDTSEAIYKDREVYYQGDVIEAADAVTVGKLDRGKEAVMIIFPSHLKYFASVSNLTPPPVTPQMIFLST
jgi:hypothetical protein